MKSFINPTPEQQMAFAKLDHNGPIVMMNLIRIFRAMKKIVIFSIAACQPNFWAITRHQMGPFISMLMLAL